MTEPGELSEPNAKLRRWVVARVVVSQERVEHVIRSDPGQAAVAELADCRREEDGHHQGWQQGDRPAVFAACGWRLFLAEAREPGIERKGVATAADGKDAQGKKDPGQPVVDFAEALRQSEDEDRQAKRQAS